MARTFRARGHDVAVITGKPYYPNWHVEPEWRGLKWLHSVQDGVRVTRCPIYVPAQPSGARRVVHLASFAASALYPVAGLLRRARNQRPDLVICVAPALFSVPVAWLAARISGAKLWIHVQDFEVEAGIATGLVRGGKRLGSLLLWVERRLLMLGDTVSSISPQMCAKLLSKGVARDRVLEIRNWADTAIRPDPNCGAVLRAAWGLGERKVGLYSGNIGNKQGIDILVEAARLLQHRGDFTIVICGDGPNRARLEQLAHGLPNVQVRGLQPADHMAELLGLAYMHLLPQLPGAADLVLPSKLTNMLASGRPVVATAAPGTGLYDEVSGCGVCSAPGDAPALAGAIESLLDNQTLADGLGQSGPGRVSERWMLTSIMDRFEEKAWEMMAIPIAIEPIDLSEVHQG